MSEEDKCQYFEVGCGTENKGRPIDSETILGFNSRNFHATCKIIGTFFLFNHFGLPLVQGKLTFGFCNTQEKTLENDVDDEEVAHAHFSCKRSLVRYIGVPFIKRPYIPFFSYCIHSGIDDE